MSDRLYGDNTVMIMTYPEGNPVGTVTNAALVTRGRGGDWRQFCSDWGGN